VDHPGTRLFFSQHVSPNSIQSIPHPPRAADQGPPSVPAQGAGEDLTRWQPPGGPTLDRVGGAISVFPTPPHRARQPPPVLSLATPPHGAGTIEPAQRPRLNSRIRPAVCAATNTIGAPEPDREGGGRRHLPDRSLHQWPWCPPNDDPARDNKRSARPPLDRARSL